MNVRLEAITEDDAPVDGLSSCACHTATRVVRTEHGPEVRYAHALILTLCAWHQGIQETFERLAGRPLPYPVWVPDGNPLTCPHEGCGQPIVGLRHELALPHPYHPHDRYVGACRAHQGVPREWVPLETVELPP